MIDSSIPRDKAPLAQSQHLSFFDEDWFPSRDTAFFQELAKFSGFSVEEQNVMTWDDVRGCFPENPWHYIAYRQKGLEPAATVRLFLALFPTLASTGKPAYLAYPRSMYRGYM